jgi:hypothetical protein
MKNLIIPILLLSLFGCAKNNSPSKRAVEERLLSEDLVRSAKRLWTLKQRESIIRREPERIIIHKNCNTCQECFRVMFKRAIQKKDIDEIAYALVLGNANEIPVPQVGNTRKLSSIMDRELLKLENQFQYLFLDCFAWDKE